MEDIRTRLVEALQRELDEHGYEDDDEKRGQVAHHFADMLLSLPGVSVVELPEADSTGGVTQSTWCVGNITVETMGSSVLWPTGHKAGYGQHCDEKHSHNGCRPVWARRLAVALLAAADAAEVSK